MRISLKSFDEVAHFWANKTQSHARSGNVSFEGDKIYSYQACIGKHLPDGNVALATHNWSMTTGRHQTAARQATRHLRQIFVEEVSSVSVLAFTVDRQVKDLIEKIATARTRKAEYVAQIHGLITNFNAYSEALRDSTRIEDITVKPEFQKILDDAKEQLKFAAAAKAKREALRREKLQEDLAKWRTGQAVEKSLYPLPVALRVKDGTIQTSHGADIPLAAAFKLWPLIQKCREGERAFTPRQPVGAYRLTDIRSDGSLVVGCHDIAYDEIFGVAKELGLV